MVAGPLIARENGGRVSCKEPDPMNITYLPTRPSKLIRVEADIPETQRAEFEQAM